jgi:transcriptional regulator
MHPNRAFAWEDASGILEFVTERSFAHVFTSSDAGLFVAHVPVLVKDDEIWFHVSRRNRIAEHVAAQLVLISVAGRDAYQSANWYASDDQVPTWHYEAAEIEGTARLLSSEELVELLDRLSAAMEARHSSANPWTRAKMGEGKFAAMTRAIVGFAVTPDAFRGTRKFNQHKDAQDLAATIEGQRGAGRPDIIEAIGELVDEAENG